MLARFCVNTGKASFRILDLWCHPIYKRELLLPRIPSCSVVSLVQDDIIYIIVDDMLNTEARGPCMLSLDMNKHRVLSPAQLLFQIILFR